MIDLEKIRARAMLMRNSLDCSPERDEAFTHASDHLLELCDEIKRLRDAMGPDALELAEKLKDIRLSANGEDGMKLVDMVAGALCAFASNHGRKGKNPPIYDIAAGGAAIRMLGELDEYLQNKLKSGK